MNYMNCQNIKLIWEAGPCFQTSPPLRMMSKTDVKKLKWPNSALINVTVGFIYFRRNSIDED